MYFRYVSAIPLHEQALAALRVKVKQRVSIRNSVGGPVRVDSP